LRWLDPEVSCRRGEQLTSDRVLRLVRRRLRVGVNIDRDYLVEIDIHGRRLACASAFAHAT
jgi:hypothetical protein